MFLIVTNDSVKMKRLIRPRSAQEVGMTVLKGTASIDVLQIKPGKPAKKL
jgi:hypothetical protein